MSDFSKVVHTCTLVLRDKDYDVVKKVVAAVTLAKVHLCSFAFGVCSFNEYLRNNYLHV